MLFYCLVEHCVLAYMPQYIKPNELQLVISPREYTLSAVDHNL